MKMDSLSKGFGQRESYSGPTGENNASQGLSDMQNEFDDSQVDKDNKSEVFS